MPIVLFSLVSDVIADGTVDEAEVLKLKEEFLADGVIDREEANKLFEINDACSGNDNHPSFEEFFISAIASHVLEDESSPGVIDAEEGDWLAGKIEGDGEIDDLEAKLLTHISTEAKEIQSEKLNIMIASLS